MKWHGWLLRLPLLGSIVRRVAVTRFCQTLSTLLDSGVPILTAIGIVEKVVQNDVLSEAIRKAAGELDIGMVEEIVGGSVRLEQSDAHIRRSDPTNSRSIRAP